MRIIGFDGGFNVVQRQSAIGLLRQGLRLNTAKHRGTTTFPSVAVGHLSHNVFIATLAMRQDAAQIALCTCGHEERRLKAQHLGNFFLQLIHTGVVAKHVIAYQGFCHGFTHASSWPRDGVASKIDAR